MPICRRGQYPGIFLFSTPARMMRPVINLITQTEELIGSFEQVNNYKSLLTIIYYMYRYIWIYQYVWKRLM